LDETNRCPLRRELLSRPLPHCYSWRVLPLVVRAHQCGMTNHTPLVAWAKKLKTSLSENLLMTNEAPPICLMDFNLGSICNSVVTKEEKRYPTKGRHSTRISQTHSTRNQNTHKSPRNTERNKTEPDIHSQPTTPHPFGILRTKTYNNRTQRTHKQENGNANGNDRSDTSH